MSKQRSSDTVLQGLRQHRRLIIVLLSLFAAAYVVLAQMASAASAWQTLAAGSWLKLFIAVVVWLISIGLAAGIYCVLMAGRLRWWPTALVQLVGAFASRVVPAGVGSVSVNYLYLRRRQVSRTEAVAVVAVNNLLGVTGNIILLAIGLLALPWQTGWLHWPSLGAWWPVWLVVLSLLGLGLVIIFGRRLRQPWLQLLGQLARFWRHPARLGFALGLSILLTACYAGALWLSGWAIGVSLSPLVALLALTLGMLALSVTPTPGGLGGVEAGVVAVLVVFGQPAAAALALALLFRLVTYWLPLLLGGLALPLALRLKFF